MVVVVLGSSCGSGDSGRGEVLVAYSSGYGGCDCVRAWL